MKEDPCADYDYVFADRWCEKKRIFPPWPARRGRRWVWWSRNMSASVGSCRWLDTWWRPIPPETRPHIQWIYWCLQKETTSRDMMGTWEERRRGRSPCLRCSCAPRVVRMGTYTQKFRHKHSLGIRCFLLPSYAFLSPNSWMRWLSLLLKYSLVPCCAGVLQYLCIKGTRLNEELHTQGQIAFMAMLYYVFLIIQVWKWTNPQGT